MLSFQTTILRHLAVVLQLLEVGTRLQFYRESRFPSVYNFDLLSRSPFAGSHGDAAQESRAIQRRKWL